MTHEHDVTARRWLQPETGAGRGSDQGFFERRRDLVAVAERAVRRLRGQVVQYLDVADGVVRRVVVDVTDGAERLARLDVVDAPAPFGLTVRELQVATGVAGGLGNPEIAVALGCARRTVATHLEHIFTKTGTKSRAGVATLVADHDAYAAPLPSGELVLPATLETLLTTKTRPKPRSVKPRPALIGAVYAAAAGPEVVAMRRGDKLAVAELNARGGVAGRQVEHLALGATPEGLLDAVTELTRRGVDAVVFGNFPLKHAREAIAAAAAAGAPVLHSMTGPALSDDVHADPRGLGSVFQVCSTESAYVPGLLRTLPHHGPRRRLAVVARESTFDAAIPEQIERHAAAAGWELVFAEAVPDRTRDFSAVVKQLAKARPDAVSLSSFPEPTLRAFLTAAEPLRDRTLVHVAWSPASPGFTDRFRSLSEGLLWSTVIGHVDSPACHAFEQRYRAAYGGEPGLGAAAVHFDMVNVLAQVWSQVSRPWDFAAVRRQLRSVASFGVTGAHQFLGRGQRGLSYPDDTGDPTRGHPHLVYRIEGGTHRRLAPTLLT
ncbi:ABC transporter substrate-binding protein [Amycolatopsis rhabdoformis]|uniref:ABC transporter substrate-binding protein n=1 Tax=Amycolatopsis rhabdoformis TaxID=1448059 RepID=A0ABZ1ICQ7_9PSEU|nr:ABC transporter substrate-binding protein [Amycolatopsis rhabdoformis]WSE31918.1 ABC transporter substrate-binding protein [Amycolatopsis rhabdoformis]